MTIATNHAITITTGSRLHFGMCSFGQPGRRQFGGAGVMIDAPAVCVRLSRAEQFGACGSMKERTLDTTRRVMQAWGEEKEPPCTIEVLQTPRQHVGLGSGTQLALAVARGLHALFDRDCGSAEELARCAGRGRRSAIGLHGFWQGGLLLEGGKLEPEQISPLVARVELPAAWRWVLVCPRAESGLSGPDEQAAFDRLPAVPEELSLRLWREAEQELLPAAARGEFTAFSRSLFRFGQLAGRCFQSQQGGVYASQQTAALVDWIRQQGIQGVGQSSWGPTLFALASEVGHAQWLTDRLQSRCEADLEITIARPLNAGAIIDGSG